MPVVQILNGEREGQDIVFDTDEIFIGKDDTCVVKITDPGVSRKHARIARQGNSWVLEDQGSSNGTYINFKKRSQNEPTELADRDILFIGRTVVKFWAVGPKGAGGAVQRDQLRDLLRGTVPIKWLPDDQQKAMREKVREAEQVEVARRLNLHGMDQGSLDRLIAQAKR